MNIQAKSAKHSAPGQYLGFALQPVRAFYHLLDCPKGAHVSLEFLDDVAVHFSDGQLCLEQTKSALKQNPIADWANDLWKALFNWLRMLKAGEISAEKAHFRIYVTPKKVGKLASMMAKAETPADVHALLEEIGKKASKKGDLGCGEYLQAILAASKEHQAAIIGNLEIESGASDPLDAIRAKLVPTVSEAHIDILVKAGIGMAKQAFDRLIQRGEPPILDADTFRKEFVAFVARNNLPGLLTSIVDKPGEDVVAAVALARPIFVRQLELIDVDQDDRLRAVSDYLRTSADKVDWAERGLIIPGSLDTWDDELVRQHGLVSGDIADLHGDKSAVVRGRLIYRQCARHQSPLEGRQVPGHFVHGSFNDLADRRLLGWHLDHATLLDGDGE